jgi:REP element-mobilizing transposase RayT
VARAPAPRLNEADYVGRRGYLLTICTYQRLPLLLTVDLVESLLVQFRQCAVSQGFANHAYSFMPDHVHFVVHGRRTDSDLGELVRKWKSETAFHFKRTTRRHLWQRSFYDRVMRDATEMAVFALYVIDNPARAGLPAARRRYPFVGSDTMTFDEIRRWKLAGPSPV